MKNYQIKIKNDKDLETRILKFKKPVKISSHFRFSSDRIGHFKKAICFLIFPLLLITIFLLSCSDHKLENPFDTENTLPAPTNLTITQTSSISCNLSWQDNSEGEQGFKIDRQKDNGGWIIPYQTVNENVETLTETGLVAGSTYKYRVYGFAGDNTSTSITGEIIMIFPAPTNLSITQTSNTSCELSWEYSGSGNEVGLKIERRLSGGSWSNIAELSINETSFEDNGLTEEEIYEYKVYAYNSLCNGNAVSETIELLLMVTDIDGNVYSTVQIGSQIWMSENLKVTHYRNGDAIPEVTDNSTWVGLNTGAWCNYNNNTGNGTIYGHLYNWYAVDDPRGIAPEGWHIPSDNEWQTLVDYLGGSSVAGGKMKETGTTHWNWPNTGATNESGFKALPGSYRSPNDGNFYSIGYLADFWSSSEYSNYDVWVWDRRMFHNSTEVARETMPKDGGLPIRCVKD